MNIPQPTINPPTIATPKRPVLELSMVTTDDRPTLAALQTAMDTLVRSCYDGQKIICQLYKPNGVLIITVERHSAFEITHSWEFEPAASKAEQQS